MKDIKFKADTIVSATEEAMKIIDVLKEENITGKFFSCENVFHGYGHIKVYFFVNEYHFRNLGWDNNFIDWLSKQTIICEGNSDYHVSIEDWCVNSTMEERIAMWILDNTYNEQ